MRTTLFIAVILLSFPLSATTPPRYQRVLVPLSVADVAGANGSVWTTELWAVNASNQPMDLPVLPCLIGGSMCADAMTIPGDRTVKVPPFGTPELPGVIVLVPSELSEYAGFSLHVRDVSRQSESWGTEIPVVREQNFFPSTKHASIAGIPYGPEYRQTLRLYGLQAQGTMRFRISLYAVRETNDELLKQIDVTLVPSPAPLPNRVGSPLLQGVVGDLFTGISGDVVRLRATIEPLADSWSPWAYWALVSITNNKTQQVTTVVPR